MNISINQSMKEALVLFLICRMWNIQVFTVSASKLDQIWTRNQSTWCGGKQNNLVRKPRWKYYNVRHVWRSLIYHQNVVERLFRIQLLFRQRRQLFETKFFHFFVQRLELHKDGFNARPARVGVNFIRFHRHKLPESHRFNQVLKQVVGRRLRTSLQHRHRLENISVRRQLCTIQRRCHHQS